MSEWDAIKFESLIGKTLTEVRESNDQIFFESEEGSWMLNHSQDCCESVIIESIVGDLGDLIGSPIVRAEENSSSDAPEGYKYDYEPESCTWTFYRIGTTKGTVVIRWLGTSNGYYSESVSFSKV